MLAITSFLLLVMFGGYRLFVVPRALSHIPHVSVFALLKSYLLMEAENRRIERLILPFANEHGHPLVLVWVFGIWILHVLDYKIGQSSLKDKTWVRQLPPQDLLLWKFVGRSNVAFTIGDTWKRHSLAVYAALRGPPPFGDFTAIVQKLFSAMDIPCDGSVKLVQWDEMSQHLSLDILGVTVLGYDFEAIEKPHSSFTDGYREVMQALSQPPYVFFPFLDKYFPRKHIVAKVNDLRKKFSEIIEQKKGDKSIRGHDVISIMLQDSSITEHEILDNVSVLFVAGHDTTSGALMSTVYYLARYTEYQEQAHLEVMRALDDKAVPDTQSLDDMPFMTACIKESMRLNNPLNMTLPRASTTATRLGDVTIPPNTMMIFNISAVHHNSPTWPHHDQFRPERFLGEHSMEAPTAFFGLGLRQCPARNFAMWELRTMMALLLREYRWSLPADSKHNTCIRNACSFTPNLNLPEDLAIHFSKRC